MLLEDSIEFDTTFPSNQSELVPMLKWENIKLSDIWIPSHLLCNRLLPPQPSFDSFKPVIFHTLEKSTPVTDSFSIYTETDKATSSNFSSCERLLDSLEDLPSSSQSSVKPEQILLGNELKNECCLDESSFKYVSRIKLVLTQIVNILKKDHCFEDIIPKCLNLIKQAITSVSQEMEPEKFIELPSSYLNMIELSLNQVVNELECDFDFEISHEYLNILDKALIQVAMTLEINYFSPQKSEQIVEKHSCLEENVDSPESCMADLLEHLCLSDEEEDNSFSEIPTRNLSQENVDKNFEVIEAKTLLEINCDSLDKLSTKLSGEVDQDSEVSNVASSDSSSEQLVDLVELSDKMWIQSQLESTSSVEEKKGIVSSSQTNNLLPCSVVEDNLRVTENQDPGILKKADKKEPIAHFPFLLEKSVEKDLSPEICEKKIKREKKMKNKASKSIPLDNFFLGRQETDLEPEFIDFYESLQKKHGHCNTESKPDFPSLSQMLETKQENVGDSCGIWDDPKTLEQKTSCHSTNIELDCNAITYVIENIPLSVDEEALQSVVLQFGDLKQMVIRRCGKTLKAEVVMTLEDPNWIIECLNGNYPFGVSSGEGLKCYQKS